MTRGLFQRAPRGRSRSTYTSYSRRAKLNVRDRRDYAQGDATPKLLAETALYSLPTLSLTELFVGGCDRPDTFACAAAWYNAARSVRSPQRARKDFE